MIDRITQRENQIANSLRHVEWYMNDENLSVFDLHIEQNNWAVQQIQKHGCQGKVVGDFGCLDGSVAFNIAPWFKHVYAFDLPGVIFMCQYEHEKVTYTGIDLDKLFPQPTFLKYDLILAIDVVEHLYNDKYFLAKCVQNLMANGSIIISTPISVDGTINQDPARQSHFREYTEEQFRELLSDVGIYIKDIHKQDDMIYIVGGKR